MRAVRVRDFGEPEVLQIEEIPIPTPGPEEVLVRVRAVGINPVETYIRSGRYAKLPTLPYTPGTDAAGVIEQAGARVTSVRSGQRVYTAGTVSGAYAEWAVCRADQVHVLPESLSFEQGAAVNIPCATAARALITKAAARPGERVLVHGASGGVGLAAVQIAKILGLEVYGTAGTEPGRQLVLTHGAAAALDHTRPGYLDELRTLTGGRGVEIIVEMLANVNLTADLGALATGGRVVIVGSRGSLEFNPREAMLRDATIFGLMLAHASAAELAELHAWLGRHLANGALRPFVGRSFPLSEAAAAHRAVMAPGAMGKIVLRV